MLDVEVVQQAVLNVLGIGLVFIIGYIAKQFGGFLKDKGILEQLQSKEAYVHIIVNAMEQMFDEADGAVKFEEAKRQAVKFLNGKGIKVDDEELDALIESAVRQLKGGFVEGIELEPEEYEDETLIEDADEDDPEVFPEAKENDTEDNK